MALKFIALRRSVSLAFGMMLAATTLGGLAVENVAAADFRIATKVFVGKEEEPVSEATTLFREGTVYDFLESPDQTAVFRKPGGGKPGRFILLNAEHKVQTEISTENLAGAMTKLRSWAERQRDPFLKFAAAPEFEETFEPDNGKLLLASHLESYTATTKPAEHPEALSEYREFLDWYAQLNTLLSGGPPPEPRLKLNEALVRRKTIPLTVELARPGEDPVRAEHEFMWRLSREDMQRIDDVANALASYRRVRNDEFLSITRPTEPAK